MKRIKFNLLLLIITTFFFSCNNNKKEINIGLLSVFSGDGAEYGKTARTGVDLAVDEINSKGGINGYKIKIIYEDSKGTSKEAVNGFHKLITVDKVPVVIGPFYSGQVLSCAPEANESKTILLSGSATADDIKNAGDFVFRVCPTNASQGKTIAEFCINNLKVKTAYILYRDVEYGLTLKEGFKGVFERLGGKILGETGIEPESKDVRTQLSKAKQKNPDIVFAPVHYPEGSVMLKQAKELNIKSIFIGGDGGFDPQLIINAGKAADGSYWATIGWGGQETHELTSRFIQNYTKKYEEEPGVYSGLYYDAMMVIAKSLSNLKDFSGAEIQKSLLKMDVYKGPTGITKFDNYGEVDKPFSIYKVENAKFIFIK